MKRSILAGCGLLAMMAAASAADLPRGPYKAPAAYSPVYNWTGLYIGAHAAVAGYRLLTRDAAGIGPASPAWSCSRRANAWPSLHVRCDHLLRPRLPVAVAASDRRDGR